MAVTFLMCHLNIGMCSVLRTVHYFTNEKRHYKGETTEKTQQRKHCMDATISSEEHRPIKLQISNVLGLGLVVGFNMLFLTCVQWIAIESVQYRLSAFSQY